MNSKLKFAKLIAYITHYLAEREMTDDEIADIDDLTRDDEVLKVDIDAVNELPPPSIMNLAYCFQFERI